MGLKQGGHDDALHNPRRYRYGLRFAPGQGFGRRVAGPIGERDREQGLKFKSSTLPERIWLTDGGAFNNFGSQWHQLRNELCTAQAAFLSEMGRDEEIRDGVSWQRERYGQVQLIVDASLIPVAKRMWPLRMPVIGFLAYFLRTMTVMYKQHVGRPIK
jgi:hypothetical protein